MEDDLVVYFVKTLCEAVMSKDPSRFRFLDKYFANLPPRVLGCMEELLKLAREACRLADVVCGGDSEFRKMAARTAHTIVVERVETLASSDLVTAASPGSAELSKVLALLVAALKMGVHVSVAVPPTYNFEAMLSLLRNLVLLLKHDGAPVLNTSCMSGQSIVAQSQNSNVSHQGRILAEAALYLNQGTLAAHLVGFSEKSSSEQCRLFEAACAEVKAEVATAVQQSEDDGSTDKALTQTSGNVLSLLQQAVETGRWRHQMCCARWRLEVALAAGSAQQIDQCLKSMMIRKLLTRARVTYAEMALERLEKIEQSMASLAMLCSSHSEDQSSEHTNDEADPDGDVVPCGEEEMRPWRRALAVLDGALANASATADDKSLPHFSPPSLRELKTQIKQADGIAVRVRARYQAHCESMHADIDELMRGSVGVAEDASEEANNKMIAPSTATTKALTAIARAASAVLQGPCISGGSVGEEGEDKSGCSKASEIDALRRLLQNGIGSGGGSGSGGGAGNVFGVSRSCVGQLAEALVLRGELAATVLAMEVGVAAGCVKEDHSKARLLQGLEGLVDEAMSTTKELYDLPRVTGVEHSASSGEGASDTDAGTGDAISEVFVGVGVDEEQVCTNTAAKLQVDMVVEPCAGAVAARRLAMGKWVEMLAAEQPQPLAPAWGRGFEFVGGGLGGGGGLKVKVYWHDGGSRDEAQLKVLSAPRAVGLRDFQRQVEEGYGRMMKDRPAGPQGTKAGKKDGKKGGKDAQQQIFVWDPSNSTGVIHREARTKVATSKPERTEVGGVAKGGGGAVGIRSEQDWEEVKARAGDHFAITVLGVGHVPPRRGSLSRTPSSAPSRPSMSRKPPTGTNPRAAAIKVKSTAKKTLKTTKAVSSMKAATKGVSSMKVAPVGQQRKDGKMTKKTQTRHGKMRRDTDQTPPLPPLPQAQNRGE
jgi:hypothetical protein